MRWMQEPASHPHAEATWLTCLGYKRVGTAGEFRSEGRHSRDRASELSGHLLSGMGRNPRCRGLFLWLVTLAGRAVIERLGVRWIGSRHGPEGLGSHDSAARHDLGLDPGDGVLACESIGAGRDPVQARAHPQLPALEQRQDAGIDRDLHTLFR